MKEKLQEYALIAEIVGGIAIVASLIFLTFEVRDSTVQSRAETGLRISELVSDWSYNLGADPVASRIYFDGLQDFSSLKDIEKKQFAYLMNSFFATYTGALSGRDLILRESSALATGTNGALQSNLAFVIRSPGFKQWWESEYQLDPPQELEPTVNYFLRYDDASQ